jgi:hypothetical protein
MCLFHGKKRTPGGPFIPVLRDGRGHDDHGEWSIITELIIVNPPIAPQWMGHLHQSIGRVAAKPDGWFAMITASVASSRDGSS